MGRIGLDPSKSVGTAFEIEGYPTLVILDGKGIVQSVHVGFNPEAAEPLNKTLAKEIDTILEGKSLASSHGQGQAGLEERRVKEIARFEPGPAAGAVAVGTEIVGPLPCTWS